ncbi:unnamed protein product [Bubo scandiacus]
MISVDQLFSPNRCSRAARRESRPALELGSESGTPDKRELGTQSGGQRGCAPAYRGLEPLPALQSARACRSLASPGLTGQPLLAAYTSLPSPDYRAAERLLRTEGSTAHWHSP